jgi:hypothetical protein
MDVRAPAILSFNDLAIVAASKGPGGITADRDSKIAERMNT